MRISKAFRWVIITCLVFILGQPGIPVNAAPAAAITVNSNADTTVVDGKCTLREAIQNANANNQGNTDCAAGSGTDSINFSPGLGVILLTSALPVINESLSINGQSGIGLKQTINGNSAYRIFESTASNLILVNLVLTDGSTITNGGAIYNSGGLTITNCTLSDNSATHQGGAIFHAGASLTISNSTFANNQSLEHSGGAIKSESSASISNCEFTGNQAFTDGGALLLSGTNATFAISDSLFEDNHADYGGGISNHSTVTITNSTFKHNIVTSYGGGLLLNPSVPDEQKAVVQGSTFTNNQAGGHGGGIYSFAGPLILTNSTFYSNTATSQGGALAIWSDGYLTATHTTISNNGGANALYTVFSSHNKLRNSIIANSTGENCNYDAPTDLGGNLQYGGSDDNSCGASIEINDPLLGELADNGGDTQTMMLLPGSPALDQIPGANGCGVGVTTDQRVVIRPINTLCDIGAVEKEMFVFLPLTIK